MISIIIPVYNREKIIAKTLDSILAQTYKDFEVVLVNDGSTDNSGKAAEKYKENFSKANIKYEIVHQQNQGAQKARNNGYKLTKGEYLLFCDGDATLSPKALETLLTTLKNHPESSYAYSSFLWGKKLFRVFPFDSEKLKKMPYIHTMALIRREHFPGFDESIKKFQDWDLWLTMLEKGYEGVWIDQVLFQIHPGGTMSSWLPAFAYKYFPFLKTVKIYNDAKEIIKNKHRL